MFIGGKMKKKAVSKVSKIVTSPYPGLAPGVGMNAF